jgi:hypothetical protein
MYRAVFSILLLAGAGAARNQDQESNVNSRYTVESVELEGAKESKLSRDLRDEIRKRVGEKYDPEAFNRIEERVRRQLGARSVHQKLIRGSAPETVKVVLEVVPRSVPLDTSWSKFAYHGKQGWTGDLTVSGHGLILGVLSDGDLLLERFAGLRAGFGKNILTDRARFEFLFETFHQQWNGATLAALEDEPDVPGIYRTRQNFQPTVTIRAARPLAVTFGFSFQRFQTQFPAARTETASAAIGTLRYRKHLVDSAANHHDVDAGYSLRAATSHLDSDFIYTRHHGRLQYGIGRGDETLVVAFQGGTITGRAPLFERFSLGNTATLRGWNKYDVAAAGGKRMAHGTLEYRHSMHDEVGLAVFYDTGAVWDPVEPARARHAAGIGLRGGNGDGFFLYVGFPIRSGRAAPIFMIGANF